MGDTLGKLEQATLATFEYFGRKANRNLKTPEIKGIVDGINRHLDQGRIDSMGLAQATQNIDECIRYWQEKGSQDTVALLTKLRNILGELNGQPTEGLEESRLAVLRRARKLRVRLRNIVSTREAEKEKSLERSGFFTRCEQALRPAEALFSATLEASEDIPDDLLWEIFHQAACQYGLSRLSTQSPLIGMSKLMSKLIDLWGNRVPDSLKDKPSKIWKISKKRKNLDNPSGRAILARATDQLAAMQGILPAELTCNVLPRTGKEANQLGRIESDELKIAAFLGNALLSIANHLEENAESYAASDPNIRRENLKNFKQITLAKNLHLGGISRIMHNIATSLSTATGSELDTSPIDSLLQLSDTKFEGSTLESIAQSIPRVGEAVETIFSHHVPEQLESTFLTVRALKRLNDIKVLGFETVVAQLKAVEPHQLPEVLKQLTDFIEFFFRGGRKRKHPLPPHKFERDVDLILELYRDFPQLFTPALLDDFWERIGTVADKALDRANDVIFHASRSKTYDYFVRSVHFLHKAAMPFSGNDALRSIFLRLSNTDNQSFFERCEEEFLKIERRCSAKQLELAAIGRNLRRLAANLTSQRIIHKDVNYCKGSLKKLADNL